MINEGEVIESTFDKLIQKDPILLFYPNTNNLKAIGALKIPLEGYKSDVFKNSKSPLKPNDFNYELGWIVVLEREKGIGNKITKLLSEFKTKIGFEKTGVSYNSKRGDYKINLYTLNK